MADDDRKKSSPWLESLPGVAKSRFSALADAAPARDLSGPPFFMVMATQNPLEKDGVFPLPDAALDRFVFKFSK